MNDHLIIRKEEQRDHKAVFDLVKAAFETMEHSDHREQYLVERLRISDACSAELSLVGEINGQIAGYVPAKQYGIACPFDVPEENCMIKILNPGAFKDVKGMVEYPQAFFE